MVFIPLKPGGGAGRVAREHGETTGPDSYRSVSLDIPEWAWHVVFQGLKVN